MFTKLKSSNQILSTLTRFGFLFRFLGSRFLLLLCLFLLLAGSAPLLVTTEDGRYDSIFVLRLGSWDTRESRVDKLEEEGD